MKRASGTDNSLQSIPEQTENEIMLHCDICSRTHTFFFSLSSPVEVRLWAEMDREKENAAFPTDHERFTSVIRG